jgi:hypothetical protein
LIHPGWAAKLKIVGALYNGREVRMSMAEPVTATEAEVEQVTKEKLMEDLRAVIANAEEVKATSLIF